MFGLLTAALPLIDKLVDRIPDPAAKEKAKLQMQADLLAALVKESEGQAEINKIEAASPSVFVSGWRPFVGWVCAGGMCYSFIGQPLLGWVSNIYHYPLPPGLDTGTLLTVLGGLLGLGGMRTVEKINGVASK